MRTTPLAALALSAVLALAGCGGGDDDPGSSPDRRASATGEPSGSASESPSSSGTPSVAPATGPLVTQKIGSLHAPAGWKAHDSGMPWSTTAFNPKANGDQSVLYLEGPWPGLEDPLDDMARHASKEIDRPTRLPDVTLDGEPAYHLRGTDGGVPTDEVGTLTRETWVQISVSTQGMSPAQRQQTVDSIVASFAWVD